MKQKRDHFLWKVYDWGTFSDINDILKGKSLNKGVESKCIKLWLVTHVGRNPVQSNWDIV